MRCYRVCGLVLSVVVLWGWLALVSSASAQAVVPPVKGGGAAAHAGKMMALETLHRAHRLLVEADHDYDGHRAKAAESVHKAIEEIEAHHRAKLGLTGTAPASSAPVSTAPAKSPVKATAAAPGSASVVKGAGAGKGLHDHEAQGVSDAQLRQAQQLLQGSLSEISVRHPHAVAHVEHAIAEINMALKIR